MTRQTSDPLASLPASPITSTSLVERDETPPKYKLGSQGNSAVRKLMTSPSSGRTLVLKDISNTGYVYTSFRECHFLVVNVFENLGCPALGF